MNRKYTRKTKRKANIQEIDRLNAEMLHTCAEYMIGKPAILFVKPTEDIEFMQKMTRKLLQQAKAIG